MPRFCLLLLLFMLPGFSRSQVFERKWIQTLNGSLNGNDYCNDVAVDSLDNIYVFGSTEVPNTGLDYILQKYDPGGNLLWARIYSNAGTDASYQMYLDKNGNAYLTGTGHDATYGPQFLTVKYDSGGNLKYSHRFNLNTTMPGHEEARAVAATDDGYAYVCGSAFSGSTSEFTVVGIDPQGGTMWHKVHNGPGNYNDSANRVIVGKDGYVYAVGTMNVEVGKNTIGIGKYHPKTGEVTWFSQQASPYGDNALGADLAMDSTTNIKVFGSSKRTDGGQSFFLFRVGMLNGLTMDPNFSQANNGTLNFTNQNLEGRRMYVDANDIAYCVGVGSISGIGSLAIAQMYVNGNSTSMGMHSQNNGGAAGGDVVADTHGAGFFTGSINGQAADQGPNFFLIRDRNGNGGGYTEYNGPANKEDYVWGVAIDSKEDVIVVGHSEMANDKYDQVIIKYRQRPYAVPDQYHAYKNRNLYVTAANSVLKNDVGAVGSKVVLDSQDPNGTVNLNSDGSFSFVPKKDHLGYFQFQYHSTKDTLVGEANPAFISVHPNIVSLSLPAEMVGGDSAEGIIGLDGPDNGWESAFGTLSASPAHLMTSQNKSWVPPSGESTAKFTFWTQSVAVNTNLTITVSRGGSSASDTVVLKPGGLVAFEVNPQNPVGGDTTQGTVKLSAPAPAGGAKVVFYVEGFHVGPPPEVTVPERQTSISFPILTAEVPEEVSNRVYAIRGGAARPKIITLRPKPKLVSLSLSPNSVHGGQNSTGTVTLDSGASAGGTTVSLSDDSGSIVTPAGMVVPGGAKTGTFVVGTTQVGAQATRLVKATLGAVSRAASLTLVPSPTLVSLSLSPTSVYAGQGSNGKVTLSKAPTLSSGVSVALTDNSSVLNTPASVKVVQGATQGSFVVGTGYVSSSATRSVTASLLGISRTANLTVNPAPTLASLTISPSSVKGGGSATGTAKLSGAAPAGGMTVDLSDNSSAITTPAFIAIPSGSSQATFTVGSSPVTTTVTRTVTATLAGISKTANITLTP